MKLIENRFYIGNKYVMVYREVERVASQDSGDELCLQDIRTHEKVFVPMSWKEEKFDLQQNIYVSYYEMDKKNIYVKFRAFVGQYKVFHERCKLQFDHGCGKNLTLVKCCCCGQLLQQGINSGECIPTEPNEDFKRDNRLTCDEFNI